MGEQRSTASGPMASKARDSLLCTLLLCAELCVVGWWAGQEKGEGGRTEKILEKFREMQSNYIASHST